MYGCLKQRAKSGCSFLTQNQTFESANRMSITNHIIQFYCNSFLTACKTQWHICKPMSATQFQAMLDITERLVAQVKGNWKCTSVLTLTKASVPPGKVSTCWPRATGTSITALWNLSTVVRRMPSSLSGPRKNINDKIKVYLQRHLTSKSITLSEVEVVVVGNHRDTAFQFGAFVSVDLTADKKNWSIHLWLHLSERHMDINWKHDTASNCHGSGNCCHMASPYWDKQTGAD